MHFFVRPGAFCDVSTNVEAFKLVCRQTEWTRMKANFSKFFYSYWRLRNVMVQKWCPDM